MTSDQETDFEKVVKELTPYVRSESEARDILQQVLNAFADGSDEVRR